MILQRRKNASLGDDIEQKIRGFIWNPEAGVFENAFRWGDRLLIFSGGFKSLILGVLYFFGIGLSDIGKIIDEKVGTAPIHAIDPQTVGNQVADELWSKIEQTEKFSSLRNRNIKVAAGDPIDPMAPIPPAKPAITFEAPKVAPTKNVSKSPAQIQNERQRKLSELAKEHADVAKEIAQTKKSNLPPDERDQILKDLNIKIKQIDLEYKTHRLALFRSKNEAINLPQTSNTSPTEIQPNKNQKPDPIDLERQKLDLQFEHQKRIDDWQKQKRNSPEALRAAKQEEAKLFAARQAEKKFALQLARMRGASGRVTPSLLKKFGGRFALGAGLAGLIASVIKLLTNESSPLSRAIRMGAIGLAEHQNQPSTNTSTQPRARLAPEKTTGPSIAEKLKEYAENELKQIL